MIKRNNVRNVVQIKLFKDHTSDIEKFEKQVNRFLSEHKDTIIVKDIKYTAEYTITANGAWQDWTAMVIYEVVDKEV